MTEHCETKKAERYHLEGDGQSATREPPDGQSAHDGDEPDEDSGGPECERLPPGPGHEPSEDSGQEEWPGGGKDSGNGQCMLMGVPAHGGEQENDRHIEGGCDYNWHVSQPNTGRPGYAGGARGCICKNKAVSLWIHLQTVKVVFAVYVMTIDQRKSRTSDDLVDPLLDQLNRDSGFTPVRAFERTAGDEVQGILDDPAAVVNIALKLAQTEKWSVGIGIGPVKEPLPESTRAGSGAAFEQAREAVEDAKHAAGHVCVRGGHPACEDVDAILQLLGALSLKRTDAAVEAGTMLAAGATQQEIAASLGISQQAVSARLRAGLWQEDQRVRETAIRRLKEADQ